MSRFQILFTGVLLLFSLCANASQTFKIKYEFLDAVVVRRLIQGLPEFDRPELLGTGTLYVDGSSNDLLGQYDLTAGMENAETRTRFETCLKLAEKTMKAGQGLVVEGSSSQQQQSGGYKNLIFLDSIIECKEFSGN